MKKVLLPAIIVIVAGIIVAVYLWNKPHPKVENASSISITAADLFKAYSANEHMADSLYLSKDTNKKALNVTGTVSKIEKNQDGGIMLILDTGDPMAGVECAMRDKNINAAIGQKVVVKGFCSGNGITGVTLTDCILQ